MSDLYIPFENKPVNLHVHEWFAILVLIGLIGGLAIITSDSQNQRSQNIKETEIFYRKDWVEVFVKGAVQFPGIYQVPSEMTMKDVLEMAQVSNEADLRRFNLDRSIGKARSINIPTKPMITIYLKGAVKRSGAISVPKGFRLQDILELDIFEENADKMVLKKKRKLKEGERINIPTHL